MTDETRNTPTPAAIDANLRAGKRRRRLSEAIIGYTFVLPAAIVTFVFGLWPVIMGFYESLKSGSPLTNRYVGLSNYVRSMGSLTYIILFAVALILLYAGYRSWRTLYAAWQTGGPRPWYYVACGVLGALGLMVMAFDLVTGAEGIGWVTIVLLLTALAGYFAADQTQGRAFAGHERSLAITAGLLAAFGVVWIGGPALIHELDLGTIGWLLLAVPAAALLYYLAIRLARIQSGPLIMASLLTSTFIVLATLLTVYAANQMQDDVAQAQRIAGQIFNQDILNTKVDLAAEDARIAGLVVDGDVTVEVKVGDETVEATVAPDAFPDVAVDRVSQLSVALSNNQPIKVILPDGTETEGTLTGLPMGQTLDLSLLAEDPQSVTTQQIYSALNIGENVILARGYTQPLRNQMLAALGVLVALANILVINHTRHQLDEEEHKARRWLGITRVLMGAAIIGLFLYLFSAVQLNRQAASALNLLTDDQLKLAYQAATGESPRANLRTDTLAAQLMYWPQVFLIGTGMLLIGAAYLVWQNLQKQETKRGFGVMLLLAVMLMVGGWLTISELPRTVTMSGRDTQDTLDALVRTALYAIGTVPVQLALGLGLAHLLFSEISWGKSMFRVIYFMPYIAPSVATAAVFLVIFSSKPNALSNEVLKIFGVDPLLWLNEPSGIVRLFYEKILGGDPLHIPGALQGPSLALFTVILYNIWVFAGYNAVIFLAGLGAIPRELYEAAEVDGAGRWSRFRNITIPLLSPTTFFLTMLSIIGTFKAFTHIYVLRGQAVGQEVDTMSIYIFNQLYAANDPGYAAALAFILFAVILVLTMTQNRLSQRQVFYG
ncbi:MAG TPA: ABC transporter permease subunit [Aggregatilinea sp.]|uniref:ABC transporter permease subunit n=1 Tax=Aggregatilinea sp. TaxID=2806333 RepID=UPI002C1B782E|nr:ABC transporter permease subunit [Aggregatilinea sp.]HML20822.1 ABC transporter permease subunit [Aggregatilinea sp.]